MPYYKSFSVYEYESKSYYVRFALSVSEIAFQLVDHLGV
jgi:hypothetical protein